MPHGLLPSATRRDHGGPRPPAAAARVAAGEAEAGSSPMEVLRRTLAQPVTITPPPPSVPEQEVPLEEVADTMEFQVVLDRSSTEQKFGIQYAGRSPTSSTPTRGISWCSP
ncbi:unnamed protein product [Prorocentrum cordatum]|uniref:Uncharacterized protein n=1 Tax=Prorocentrum cordatum TaxID=2364126 RepID=A0ABN9WJ45_9DINO|nr:unnamed protein product [Polarella glacialis]